MRKWEMSAVSSEPPRASADLSEPASPQPASETGQGWLADGSADFGPNEWLVDELYQRYQTDPD
jgi:hypothetical protein